ncbi:hypothetical protein RIF29_23238 [Crotalaria pallida]|uniref:Uncharacterized protein n=1 Tax=Crotalaria pallida TaxID=3830 RepID=A0AAN9IEZ6_CROPI
MEKYNSAASFVVSFVSVHLRRSFAFDSLFSLFFSSYPSHTSPHFFPSHLCLLNSTLISLSLTSPPLFCVLQLPTLTEESIKRERVRYIIHIIT